LSLRLQVQATRRAAREIRAASKWWDENRPAAPDAFREAIDKAFELICTQPHIGEVATNVKLPGVRRILLSKVQYYLYYRVRSKPHTVEVVAIWQTSRYPDLNL
jgi:plasmid stabilization system protein ParE